MDKRESDSLRKDITSIDAEIKLINIKVNTLQRIHKHISNSQPES